MPDIVKNNYEQHDWDVKQLLMEWKLDSIWPHLMDQKIDGDVLQMIKLSHIQMLLGAFPLGIQIRFEYHLEQWRCTIGRPLNGHTCDEISAQVTQKLLKDTSTSHPTPESCPRLKQETPLQMDTNDASNSLEDPLLTESGRISPETPSIQSNASTSSFGKNNSAMPYTSKGSGPEPNVNLHEILMECRPEGPQLIRTYRLNKCFCKTERRRLIDILAHYYLRNNLDFGLQTSYAIERAILKMFPSERLDMYRRAKQGSIYCKYSSAKSSYKKQQQGNDKQSRRPYEANDEMFDVSNMEAAGILEAHSNSSAFVTTILNDPAENDETKLQYNYSYVEETDTQDVKPSIVEHKDYI